MIAKDHFSARVYIRRKDELSELKTLEKAREELAKYGIIFSVGPGRDQNSKDYLACVLSISFDREITGRRAGRKEKASGYTLADIEKLRAENLPPQEIADRAGVSIATYYRRLKKAMEQKESGMRSEEISF